MAFTYDLATDVGKVRLITRDTRTPDHFFEDEEIATFLTLNGDSLRRAAADVLDTWASDEAMVTKAVTLLDISTNGPAVADALRKHAALLRKLADEEENAEDPGFDIAELALGPWSLREQVTNRRLRG